MTIHEWNAIPLEPLNDLIGRRMVHTARMTLAYLELKPGAVVPMHSHENEQVTNLVSGRLRFIFEDGEVILDAGQSLEIPSNAPHRVEALEASVALDVFSPRREDWIRGDDAYLRRK